MSVVNLFICFSFDRAVKTFSRDKKLYLLSSWSNHLLGAEKSLIMPPALGWMVCMVDETMVFKLWLVKRFPKKKDSLAASAGMDGQ